MKYRIILLNLLTIFLLSSCKSTSSAVKSNANTSSFITVKDSQFFLNGEPYYFVGTNYWYGPLLGAKNIGNRERLISELDLLQDIGINNLRILVGAEGDGDDYKVYPTLQPEQGVYNENLLDGLDFLMHEMRKRNMYAVLYLNNNWIWSGGMSEYLKWNGYGTVPNPFLEEYSWDDYMRYTMQFHSCEPCMEAYYKHVKFIIGRTNSYSGIKYTEDKTVMSWQVANEPRVLVEPSHEKAFAEWLNETVNIIETLAPNQLISTGAEGSHSYLDDIDMFERLHTNKDIDYLTMHMWPKNWGWYDSDNEKETLQKSIEKAYEYMNEHIVVAEKLNKPIVMSEFGFPRAKESNAPYASVEYRNIFYEAIINKVLDHYKSNKSLAGLNFWGFGGYGIANPNHDKWEKGDDFTGDPPQEPQGLNTVFASDYSTLNIIKKANFEIAE
ncbi:beta-mannanase [Flavivirga abyssicola]|uniref:glycoside hydrolase 5 family protein n=1 Tax=Flavivirga abyssicola TaxID=3063533 RepID=UPI0026E0DE99|nr:beta-mannanase [Flavivirga sp. MEBiC07777]WVK12580.1 beta-mannanase [Flavivirga sp. MEBiC07777]